MESILGRGYSIDEESDLIDQYSPLSSTIDEDLEQDDDLFYPEENHGVDGCDRSSTVLKSHGTLSSSSIDEISGMGLGKGKQTLCHIQSHCLPSSEKVHSNHRHSKWRLLNRRHRRRLSFRVVCWIRWPMLRAPFKI